MGVLKNDLGADFDIVLGLASGICQHWNENGGKNFGFSLFVPKESAKRLSEEGDQVLAYFADEPGPFKRVATLVVLSRLLPLFTIASVNSTRDNLQKSAMEIASNSWLPRLSFLLIRPALRSLYLKNTDGNLMQLPPWRGFPSLHSKAEFLFLLQWMRDFPNSDYTEQQDAHRLERRGRMVLAVALILEAVFYQKTAAEICGFCDRALIKALSGKFTEFNLRELLFDAYLADYVRRKSKGLPLVTPDEFTSEFF